MEELQPLIEELAEFDIEVSEKEGRFIVSLPDGNVQSYDCFFKFRDRVCDIEQIISIVRMKL